MSVSLNSCDSRSSSESDQSIESTGAKRRAQPLPEVAVTAPPEKSLAGAHHSSPTGSATAEQSSLH